MTILLLWLAISSFSGCVSANHYGLIEQNLLAGKPERALSIVEQAESDYGSKSRLLYLMDRGMTLHLAGYYAESNETLEQADELIARLYTKTIRSETLAFLTNDNALPYEGDPYEHVMVNVVKALNYALQNDTEGALVETRRIDHRLNVLSDRLNGKRGYGNDGFARYLSGMLYEASGDLNNAFVAYRNACEAYETMRAWIRLTCPPLLRADLLSSAEALGLADEVNRYRTPDPAIEWLSMSVRQQLAQVVLISYNGRAPWKEDLFFDLPIGLEALQLVLLNRGFSPPLGRRDQIMDSILYGLSGRVVRVALPHLVSQKTLVSSETLTLMDEQGQSYAVRSERVHDLTALAENSLADRLPAMTVKAVARAAAKFSMAEGAVIGAKQAVGRDAAPWVGLLVGLLTKGLAVATEEADKRSWRTLPDEIHVARVWVPPGRYRAIIHPIDRSFIIGQGRSGERGEWWLDLSKGQTKFLVRRVLQ
ncbi:MAG: COG3014 family protein [Nitrospira sp.]